MKTGNACYKKMCVRVGWQVRDKDDKEREIREREGDRKQMM
jgi:hypothetical protein